MPQTIDKATQILDLFSLTRPEWGVSEAARALELPKSTASVLMSSLARRRILSRIDNGRYRLGWRLFELSQTILDTTEFRVEALRAMEELVQSWRETLHLAVLDGVQALYIEKLQPSPAVKIPITRPGARVPAHSCGVGKVLLAHGDWEYLASQLEDQGMPALTSNTIATPDALADELEWVRELRYAYDNEETLVGLCCVAAPIYDSGGTVVAAVSFSVPAYRFHAKKEKYTAAILDAASRISENAGPALEVYPDDEMEMQGNRAKTTG
jgi:DNA-binding IclR family transcriptional regulator